ncbi:MAG: SPOR domain-containing protein [Treponema sp.]|jgi:DedD protein|nr:SPOR domain-containing protein [Treponema sp.]
MEKKKLLLVAVSVGVVLLIILIIPLLIISPRKDFGGSWQEQSAVIEPPNLTQGWESIKEPEPPVEVAVVPAPKAVEQPSVTTLTVPAPRSVAVPDAVVSPARQAPKVKPVQAAEAPKEAKPQAAAVAAKPAVEKSAAAVKPPVAKAADKSAAEKPKPAKTYDSSKYWIQTGAFSTITYAEGAKDYLEARGIKSIIEDPVINGKTWYRVRVGPYTTRDEANYWLALVKAIDGFASSQVWEAR